jgi:hypothetical protein
VSEIRRTPFQTHFLRHSSRQRWVVAAIVWDCHKRRQTRPTTIRSAGGEAICGDREFFNATNNHLHLNRLRAAITKANAWIGIRPQSERLRIENRNTERDKADELACSALACANVARIENSVSILNEFCYMLHDCVRLIVPAIQSLVLDIR